MKTLMCLRTLKITQRFLLAKSSSVFRTSTSRHRFYSSSNISSLVMGDKPISAGIIVIGDEIIKGQVQDCNSHFMCKRLHQLGVHVKTVITIPDDQMIISKYVRDFSEMFTYVLTAGGIGPTHDDITYEAVAAGFNEGTRVDEELETLYKSYFQDKYTESHRKLATIPISASLYRNDGGFPVVNIRNIFILPGVPKFLKIAFSTLEERISNPSEASVVRELYLSIDEMSIAGKLTDISKQYAGRVTIGSYPEWQSNYFKLKLVLECDHCDSLDECVTTLRESLPANCILDYNNDPMVKPMEGLNNLLTGNLSQPLQEAIDTLTEALQRYKLDEICIGFNGGKDCTALLHLWYAVVSQSRDYRQTPELGALYIRSKTPWPEVEVFIEECIVRYNLNMMRFDGGLKDQLTLMKTNHPQIKAVIMGTRSTDPHGANMKAFHPTDSGWPELMRINPILNFSYNNIWELLRGLSLPYCSLYDKGYTSLGSIENTHLNPALRYTDSNGVVHYKPAYQLELSNQNQSLERAGRDKFIPPPAADAGTAAASTEEKKE